MARHKVEISGVNTANIKVLTQEEMVSLFKEYQNGNQQAREDLINGNLKLVLSILRGYTNRTDNLDDLFQVGCIGLVKAIDNFDLAHDVKFSTYAVPMISGEVRRYIRDNSSIRVSRSLKDIAYRTLKEKEALTAELGREPTVTEISNRLHMDEVEINYALDALKNPISMFEPIYNDNGDSVFLADQLEDKNSGSEAWENKIFLEKAIQTLRDREREILVQRFIVGKTQAEIAGELGISQAQVSRLEKNAIQNMRENI